MKNSTLFRVFPVILFLFSLLQSCVSAQENKFIITGAERLSIYIDLLKNKHVGIVANHTSLVRGVHLFDTLRKSGVQITAMYAPEHGFLGLSDAGAFIGNTTYGDDSVPVISLYGKKKKPTPADMQHIDIMVLRSAGCRSPFLYLS
jgi:uncharacterized protein YbbC (DUF1343 family)